METISRTQLLEQACALLRMYPGVSVVSAELAETDANLRLSVANSSSVEQIYRLAMAANVSSEQEPRRGEPVQLSSHAGTIRMLLSASTVPRDTIAIGALQLLCIHSVWHLHRVGYLSAQLANPLLERWSASRVGI
jgi:hypothetical protein